MAKAKLHNTLQCDAMLQQAPDLAQKVARAMVDRVKEYTNKMAKYAFAPCGSLSKSVTV